MRTFLLLFTLLGGLSACAPFIVVGPYATTEPRLTPLPTPAHGNSVEVFFPGEKMPIEPYVKIQVVSTERYSGRSVNQAIADLQRKGQQVGADALILLGKKFHVENKEDTQTTTDSTGTHTTTTVTTTEWDGFDALAIKYVKNITYLADYLKEKRVFQLDSTGQWQQVATLEMAFDGSISKRSGDPELVQLLEQTDVDPVRLDKILWKVSNLEGAFESAWLAPWSPSLNHLRYRFYKQMNGPNLLQVAVKSRTPIQPAAKLIHYQYNAKGVFSHRVLTTTHFGRLKETTSRDSLSGKPSRLEFNKIEKDNAETPFLRVEMIYHTQGDLQSLLK